MVEKLSEGAAAKSLSGLSGRLPAWESIVEGSLAVGRDALPLFRKFHTPSRERMWFSGRWTLRLLGVLSWGFRAFLVGWAGGIADARFRSRGFNAMSVLVRYGNVESTCLAGEGHGEMEMKIYRRERWKSVTPPRCAIPVISILLPLMVPAAPHPSHLGFMPFHPRFGYAC